MKKQQVGKHIARVYRYIEKKRRIQKELRQTNADIKKIMNKYKDKDSIKAFFDYYEGMKSKRLYNKKCNIFAGLLPECVRCGVKFYASLNNFEPIKRGSKKYCQKCINEIEGNKVGE